ncbi:hypothetical protein [Thalassotalea crassostreae]|uniref:hypothetical protein n=1 Tax=Thalassotalea crassostreae TaxID=1763536 RepID=UPI0008A20B44|nr:hypothetical protein [Thalassotalea crassostreae]
MSSKKQEPLTLEIFGFVFTEEELDEIMNEVDIEHQKRLEHDQAQWYAEHINKEVAYSTYESGYNYESKIYEIAREKSHKDVEIIKKLLDDWGYYGKAKFYIGLPIGDYMMFSYFLEARQPNASSKAILNKAISGDLNGALSDLTASNKSIRKGSQDERFCKHLGKLKVKGVKNLDPIKLIRDLAIATRNKSVLNKLKNYSY